MITNQAKTQFWSANSWLFVLLPQKYLNLIIMRWFNSKTTVFIDVQNWGGKFDYMVGIYDTDKVFVDNTKSENRSTDFDATLAKAIVKANQLFNEQKIQL